MKKIFGLMLLCATMVGFVSCEKDEGNASEGYPSIIGTWSQLIGSSSGDNATIDTEVVWIFRENNTATEQLLIIMNGTVVKTQNLQFTYTYYGTYIDLKNDKTTIRYNVSISGNTMRLGNDESGYFNLTKW